MSKIQKGDYLLCITSSGYPDLTVGEVFVAAADEEPGIFPGRPYIQVTKQDPSINLILGCHVSRFIKVESPDPPSSEEFWELVKQRQRELAGLEPE